MRTSARGPQPAERKSLASHRGGERKSFSSLGSLWPWGAFAFKAVSSFLIAFRLRATRVRESSPTSKPQAPVAPLRVLALCLLALAACADPNRPGPPRDGRLCVIVIDATNAAHLSSYGGPAGLTPNIDALAARGRRFARAVSNNTWTLPSTASLMTGQLQERHAVATPQDKLPASAHTLADSFQSAGWLTAGFVQMAYAAPEYGFDQGFDSYDYYGVLHEERKALGFQTVPDTERWMDSHRDENYFLYLHMRRPHSPYKPHGKQLARVEGPNSDHKAKRDSELEGADAFGVRDLPAADRERVTTLYRANLATVDAQLKSVLDRCARDGVTVVLTSDHGEALGERGWYGHGDYMHSESVSIPLIIAGPGIEAGTSNQVVSTVDLFPTLHEWFDLPMGQRSLLDGESLATQLRESSVETNRRALISARHRQGKLPQIGVIEGDWKLIWQESATPKLFNLAQDPFEFEDRYHSEPTRARELERTAQALAEKHRLLESKLAGGAAPSAGLNADLEALGYLKSEDEEK